MEKNKKRIILAMAVLQKGVAIVDKILADDGSTRFKHWRSQLYTILEDMQDYTETQD